MVSTLKRDYSRYRQIANAAYGVKRAYKFGKRMYNSYKRFKSGRTEKSPIPVSFQHDFSNQYRRKRAPRRVKRVYRRQAKNFRHQLVKTLGTYSRVFNNIEAPSTLTPTSLATSQTVTDVMLYGGSMTQSQAGRLFEICQDLLNSQSTAKVYFKSAVLNAQIRNTDSESPLIVDVYKVYCRKESYDRPGLEWAQCLTNQVVANGAGVMGTGQMGCTPWDAPGFGVKWLIGSKTRYRISPGASIYLQMRDPKNHEFETSRFDYDSGVPTNRVQMFKGLTKGFVFVARSSALDATNSFGGEINWQVITEQTYHYVINSGSFDQAGAN